MKVSIETDIQIDQRFCFESQFLYSVSANSLLSVRLFQEDTEDDDAMPIDCRAGIVPATAKEESATKFFDFRFVYHRIRSLSDQEDKANAAETVITQMCACLTERFPIIFGFEIFYGADGKTREIDEEKNWTGNVFNAPKLKKRKKPIGGHTVLCVGFDRTKKLFHIMNSWGNDWGDNGYFWMPFSWFEHSGTTYDLWTIRPDVGS